MKRISSRWQACVVCGVLAGVLATGVGGCARKRPLSAVEENGDKAFARGNYDVAVADYLEYVERRPGSGEVQYKLARTLLEVKQPAKAVEHAWVAYDAEPQNDQYVETLARSLYDASRIEELNRLLRDQVEDRGRVQDYLRLGKYAALTGDADGAELAFLTAAKLDAGRTMSPQMALARFYMSIGDKLSAYERLRMALYFDPQNAQVYQEIRRLGEVPGPTLVLLPKELPPDVKARKQVQAKGG